MNEQDFDFPSFRMERKLRFKIAGQFQDGVLSVGDVKWEAGKKKWACHWSISFVHPEIGATYGSDPLDAFLKALDFLSILLRGSEDDGLVVFWSQEGDHAGVVFPLSEGRRWEQIPPGYKGTLPPGLGGPP